MSADILGTSWDQCRSVVQYSFTSTETRRFVRTDSPGRPPWLSYSSWTMCDVGGECQGCYLMLVGNVNGVTWCWWGMSGVLPDVGRKYLGGVEEHDVEGTSNTHLATKGGYCAHDLKAGVSCGQGERERERERVLRWTKICLDPTPKRRKTGGFEEQES